MDNPRIEANLYTCLGLNKLELRQVDDALHEIDTSIDILTELTRKSSGYAAWDDLFTALGLKLTILHEENRLEEAKGLRPVLEETLLKLEACEDVPADLVDIRRGIIYASYAYIYAQTGNTRESENCYRLFETGRPAHVSYRDISAGFSLARISQVNP